MKMFARDAGAPLALVLLSLCCSAVCMHAQVAPAYLERAKMTTTDVAASEIEAVAIAGDTMVAGDPGYNNHGAAFVFERSAAGWTSAAPVAVLTPSDGEFGDQFGLALAIEDDTIVVGAPQAARAYSTKSGAVYVFEKPAGGWADMTETVKLTPCCAGGGYTFGASVAIERDVIAIGATQSNHSLSARRPGGVHVFERPPGTSWTQAVDVARLAASDGFNANHFGAGVAIDHDVVLVGAPLAVPAGAVYLFQKPPVGWLSMFETGRLVAASGAPRSLGSSISLLDGYAAVGAPQTEGRGAVFVFRKRSYGWASANEVAKLQASDGDFNDDLGASVAADGDLIVAGALGGGFADGAVYLFEEPASGWSSTSPFEVAKLELGPRTLRPFTIGTSFGGGVALDGRVVAATSNHVLPVGAAYVFDEPPVSPGSGCGLDRTDLSGSTRIQGQFDMSVAACSGAGAPEFVLGAPLPQPVALPPALSCTGASPCLVSCNPLLRIPAASLSFTWANDPSYIGISLCIQGLCLDAGTPCVELSDMVTITITS